MMVNNIEINYSKSYPIFKYLYLLTAFSSILSISHAANKKTYPASAFDQSTLKLEEGFKVNAKVKILIIPGDESVNKPSGNHEYMAGASLLAKIFNNLEKVHASISNYDWPKNEKLLDQADVIVIYSNGDGKQGLLLSKERILKIDKLVDKGVGFVNLHASICYPNVFVPLGQKWIGGVWTKEYSNGNRGHWKSSHSQFPKHAVTSGVTPWSADDGWCHKILIPEGSRQGINPLLWSSKEHKGDPKGGDKDIVAWTFDRLDGGRSFSCSGAHEHWEWANNGLRKMIVNGILWTAKQEVPPQGFNCKIDKENMNQHFDKRKN